MDYSDLVRFCGYETADDQAPEPYCIECRNGDCSGYEHLEDRECPGEGTAGCHHGEVTEGLECARCEGTGFLPWCVNCGRWVDIKDWYPE